MSSIHAERDASAFTTLLTERELATRINRSPRTLQADRLRGGGIPYIKIGHSVRYDWDAVRTYLATHTRQSTSDTADRRVRP